MAAYKTPDEVTRLVEEVDKLRAGGMSQQQACGEVGLSRTSYQNRKVRDAKKINLPVLHEAKPPEGSRSQPETIAKFNRARAMIAAGMQTKVACDKAKLSTGTYHKISKAFDIDGPRKTVARENDAKYDAVLALIAGGMPIDKALHQSKMSRSSYERRKYSRISRSAADVADGVAQVKKINGAAPVQRLFRITADVPLAKVGFVLAYLRDNQIDQVQFDVVNVLPVYQNNKRQQAAAE